MHSISLLGIVTPAAAETGTVTTSEAQAYLYDRSIYTVQFQIQNPSAEQSALELQHLHLHQPTGLRSHVECNQPGKWTHGAVAVPIPSVFLSSTPLGVVITQTLNDH
mmetsp:Transcript_21058/g.70178  ORF Transcript_21058/g.70178 Transcript_21058/m.70178 type:complete len:107 (-) Transcript_21058:1375-1695(-)